MAELEALSNKELKQKCVEFGLPNVPVTDSSRKVLIRRLEAVMSGKPITTTPSKNRRETMHVSKPSEVASSPKITINNNTTKEATSNRPSRRTIAVPERHVATTTTVSEPEYSDVSPDRVEPRLPPVVKDKTPEKPPTLYPKLPAKEPSPKPQQLSKTGVVTTSYIKETAPVNQTYAAPEEIDSAEEYTAKSVKKTITNPPLFSYVPLSESKVSTTAPLTSLSSSTRYSSSGSFGYNYSRPISIPSTSNIRNSYVPPTTSYNKPSMQHQSQYVHEYEAELADEEDYEEDEDVVLVEESPIKDMETPFLSQFARNLETLKATPIRHSVGPTRITPPKSNIRNRDAYSRRTIASPSSNINPRRNIRANNENDTSFRQLILAMEEKYHLKHSLILISIFILAVFVYVFFIQSV